MITSDICWTPGKGAEVMSAAVIFSVVVTPGHCKVAATGGGRPVLVMIISTFRSSGVIRSDRRRNSVAITRWRLHSRAPILKDLLSCSVYLSKDTGTSEKKRENTLQLENWGSSSDYCQHNHKDLSALNSPKPTIRKI